MHCAAAYAAEVARKRKRSCLPRLALPCSFSSRAGWRRSTSACSSPTSTSSPTTSAASSFSIRARSPGSFVLFDIPGWFWGLGKWLRLLADTLLIAYVATVLGAVFGFLAVLPRGRKSRRLDALALCRAPLSRVLPHRAGTRLRADLRAGLRPRAHRRRAGHHRSHHRRARQAVLRSAGEHRPEAGRGPHRQRRLLDQDHALRRAAAGALQLPQLCPAALRDQCARRLGHGFRRRRRHRPGPDRGHPQVLLSGRLRHPACSSSSPWR